PRPPPVSRVLAMRPLLRVAADGSAAATELHPPLARMPERALPRNFALLAETASAAPAPESNPRVAAQVLLSAGGAELERALRGSGGRLPAAPTVRSGTPLTRSPPPSPTAGASDEGGDDRVSVARSVMTLASALRTAVTQSGLFYESHLARWVADDFAQAELDHEPQSGVKQNPVADADPAADIAEPMTALVSALADDPAPPAAGARASVSTRGDNAPLLRQQLDLLDTRQFVWVGEAWPGQRTAIRFEEDREHQTAQDPALAARTLIRAHVILELPELGTIGAEIAIIQGAVHLQITTDGPAATLRLHAARAELAEALAARALPAGEIVVFDAL
ncbi:MAG: flagellar hook-length control protein FliK, partial [Casimicrobiaceae bacterium]